MSKPLLTCLLVFTSMLTAAQQQKKKNLSPSLLYTSYSNRYLSAAEKDALLYATSAEVFKEYKLPESVLEKRYPAIRKMLVDLSRKDILQSFRWVESTSENTINAAVGTRAYQKNKELYIKYFKSGITHAFYHENALAKQLYFNKNDRITCFRSQVNVLKNGKLLVKESITIYNGDGEHHQDDDDESGYRNNEIKKGIIRSFPVVYRGKYKLNYNTSFDLKEVKRDGKPEPYQLKRSDNGYYLRIGDATYDLPTGSYQYDITYETAHQLKFLAAIDVLSWNVTGNGWNFRIDSAICTFQLPAGTGILSNACYTGAMNSKESQCEVTYNQRKDSLFVAFRTTRPLAPKEGLTVASSWCKGIIQPPSFWDKCQWMIRENLVASGMFLVIALLLIYNFITWWLIGRDPAKGNIIPLFYPPANLSPAAMGFIDASAFHNRLVAATVMDLAVRNYVRVAVKKEGLVFKSNVYKVSRPAGHQLKVSYEDFKDEVEDLVGSEIKKGKYNPALGDLRSKVERYCTENILTNKNGTGFITLNNKYMAPGNFLIALSFFGLLFGVFPRNPKENVWQLPYLVGGAVLCLFIQRFYYHILKAYTVQGRKLLDQIEGFKMYLKTADEQRLNAMNPPEKTLELYERYLPFAVALECEIAWAEKFQAILATAVFTSSDAGFTHSFVSMGSDSNNFSVSFSSNLSGAISSASSPPSSSGSDSGSSSSSSGGGSSGSGGGGGGGGGW